MPVPNLHATAAGEGRPVVLLHGWATSGRALGPLVPALAARARVACLDLPGHGRSPPSPEASSLDALGRAVAGWVRQAGLVRPVLGGWSLGAMVALSAAAHLGGEAAGLLLVAPTPRFTTGDDWPHGLPAAQVEGLAARMRIHPGKAIARFLSACVGEEEVDPAARTAALALLSAEPPDPGSAQAALGALASGDLRPILPGLALPALLVHGERDAIVPAAASVPLARSLPGARRVLLAGAGHAPHLTRPDAVAAPCLSFLERVAP